MYHNSRITILPSTLVPFQPPKSSLEVILLSAHLHCKEEGGDKAGESKDVEEDATQGHHDSSHKDVVIGLWLQSNV